MEMQQGSSIAQLGNQRPARQDTFDALLLGAARSIGEYAPLDERLYQSDEPTSPHITMMNHQQLGYLLRFDKDYSLNTRI